MGKIVKQPHGGAVYQASKGETRNPNGRPPKLVSYVIEELKDEGYTGVTKLDVKEAFEYLLNLPIDKVIEISGNLKDKDNKYPALMRMVAKEMLGKRGQWMLRDMLDRAHGQSKQEVDMTSGGEPLSFGALLKEIDGDTKQLVKKKGKIT